MTTSPCPRCGSPALFPGPVAPCQPCVDAVAGEEALAKAERVRRASADSRGLGGDVKVLCPHGDDVPAFCVDGAVRLRACPHYVTDPGSEHMADDDHPETCAGCGGDPEVGPSEWCPTSAEYRQAQGAA